MHLTDDRIRSFLDNELPEPERARVLEHLNGCVNCQQQVKMAEARKNWVNSHLAILNPTPGETFRPPAAALKEIKKRQKETTFMKKIFHWPMVRYATAVLTLVMVMLGSFSFPPVRGFASSFLGMFRVQQVTILPLDINSSNQRLVDNPSFEKAMKEVASDSIKVTKEAGEIEKVNNLAEASQKANFHVRLPQNSQPSQISVHPLPSFEMVINRQKAQELLEMTGQTDLKLPENLDGAKIRVETSALVEAAYGECAVNETGTAGDAAPSLNTNCWTLSQTPSPEVEAPEGLDLSGLANIALQVSGMSPEEAARVSRSIDWATTLVIPVPRNTQVSKEIQVDGVNGYLFSSSETKADAYQMMVWVKDGTIFTLAGRGDASKAFELARSLK